jgi:hypothetical protein
MFQTTSSHKEVNTGFRKGGVIIDWVQWAVTQSAPYVVPSSKYVKCIVQKSTASKNYLNLRHL